MTTLDPNFLRAVVLMTAFKPDPIIRVQACLLSLAVNGIEFTAADLPREVTNGDIHLAGCACGALVSEGLITAVGRRKSPDPLAKGRKLNVYRLALGKLGTVRAWFAAQKLEVPKLMSGKPQMELLPRAA